jgi:hypothetical protein
MKARPLILIFVTLIIGFALGILASARIRYSRLKPVRIFFSEERFREGFYNIIQPDEKQIEAIDELLSKYGGENTSFQDDFRKKLDSLMREFWKELNPLLTKDQQERLKEMEKKRMEMFRQHRRPPFDSSGFRGRMRGMEPGPGGRRFPGGPPYHKPDSPGLQ